MKQLVLFLLLLSEGVMLAQEQLTVREFLARKGDVETGYCVKGVYVDVIDRLTGADFILEDESGQMWVQLARNGARTEYVFRTMDIRPGDTLTVMGTRGRVQIPGKGSKRGMQMASILSKTPSPDHDHVNYHLYPSFQGKGAYVFSEWVEEQLVYPYDRLMWGEEGNVVISFNIEKDGRITSVRVAESSGKESLDKEAVRVVSASPPWLPGMENGKATRVFDIQFPIYFRVNRRPIGK